MSKTKIEAARKAEIQRYFDALDAMDVLYGTMPDDDLIKLEDEERSRHNEAMKVLDEQLRVADIKAIRPNEWFKNFLESFKVGKTYLSDKQAHVFNNSSFESMRDRKGFLFGMRARFGGRIYHYYPRPNAWTAPCLEVSVI